MSVIEEEVRSALKAASNEPVDDAVLNRCIDVGLAVVGSSHTIEIISVAYNLYLQQYEDDSNKSCDHARSEHAKIYLDSTARSADRIYNYIAFKLPEGMPIPTAKILDVVAQAEDKRDIEAWRDWAYSQFSTIPPAALAVRIVLQDLYLASIRSLLHNNFRLLSEKSIECLVLYSEFASYGFDPAKAFPMFDKSAIITVRNSDVQSLPVDLFVQIHKWRIQEKRVCISCDTDGLNVSGLVMARYLSLYTRRTRVETVKAIKIAHGSFMPRPHDVAKFTAVDVEEDGSAQLEVTVPTSESMKSFDERTLADSINDRRRFDTSV